MQEQLCLGKGYVGKAGLAGFFQTGEASLVISSMPQSPLIKRLEELTQ